MKYLFNILIVLLLVLLNSCIISPKEDSTSLQTEKATPPENINIFPYTTHSAVISWNENLEANSNSIYISTDELGVYELIQTINDNTYIIQNLSTDIKYFFRVSTSYNNIGESRRSSPVFIIIVDLQKPVGLTSTVASSTSLNISWSAVSESTGYKIYRSSSSSGNYTLIGSTSETNYTDTGLESGTTYFYKISGRKNDGEGPLSDFFSTFTPVSVPTGLQGTLQSVNSIKLSWNSVQKATEYVVYRSLSDSGPFNPIATTVELSTLDSELSQLTDYYYRVSAKNSNGEGDLSETILMSTPPSPPANIILTVLSSSSIKIDWDTVSGATGYKIYRALTSTGTYTTIVSTSETNYTDNGLESGTTYFYKISSVRNNGEGALSNFVSAFTPVSVPTGLLGTVQSMNSIRLTWNSVQKATEYIVYRSLVPEGPFNSIATTAELNILDSGLSQLTDYYYKVSAKNSNGEGNLSEPISISIAPPSTPENITSTVLSSSSIKLDWDTVSGATGYKIYRSSGGDYTLAGTVSNNSFTNTGLSLNVYYYYKITAVNISGESIMSPPVDVIIKPPAAPTNIQAVPYTESSIRISWDAVEEALFYDVYRGTRSGDYIMYNKINTAIITNTYYIDTGLTAGDPTEYQYRVRAINAIGTSVESATARSYVLPIPLNKAMWYSSSFSYSYNQYSSNSRKYFSIPINDDNINISIEIITRDFEWGNPAGSFSMNVLWNQNNSMLGGSEIDTPYFMGGGASTAYEKQISPPSSGYLILRFNLSAMESAHLTFRIKYE
jgi:fibronectin type 3 domain-containing protein